MKTFFGLLMVTLMMIACQKSSELEPPAQEQQTTVVRDGTQPGSLSAQRINTVQNPLQLAVQICGFRTFEPMTVKVIHWDYVNGHTPMVITGRDSFRITTNYPDVWVNRRFTGFTYTGKMQIEMWQDSLNLLKINETIMLTDSLGWTMNLDTTSVQHHGWVGQNRVTSIVPKSYQ
jgi:hypothetical protein